MQGKRIIKLLLIGILVFLSGYSWSQEDIHIYGTVKELETNHKLESVLVQVTQDGKSFDTFTTSGSSKFEFDLPLGHLYEIDFSKSGYIKKKIQINTKYIPEEDQEGGFKLDLDMSLFEYIEGFNESILDEPIGIAAYDAERNSIEFDFDYTRQIMNKVDAEIIRLQNLDVAEVEKRKRFEELMIQGSDNLTKEKYEQAVGNYTNALNLYPDELEAQSQLEEAERLLALQNQDAELEAQYQEAIKEGNSLMKAKDYQSSMSRFEEAKSLKPEEREPKDKIRELEALIASEGDRMKFDEFMASGDSAMGTEDFQSAVDKYKLARDIISDDKEMKKKLAEAQEKLDALLSAADAEAAEQKRYDDIIARADGSFENEDYDLAINQYNSALEIFSSEEYPISQIALAEERIKELEEEKIKDSASAEQDLIDVNYQKLIDEGNALFTSEELIKAKDSYQAALDLKSSEKYPAQRIIRIDELLKEKENAKNDQLADEASAVKEKERLAALEREKELAAAAADEERLRLEQELADKERILEEERRKKADAEDARRNLASNIDTKAERQAEEFYKQQKLDEDKEKHNSAQQKKEDYVAWLQGKAENSLDQAKDSKSEIESSKNNMQKLYSDGENYHKDKRESFDSGAKQIAKDNLELETRADDTRKDASYLLNEFKENSAESRVDKNRSAIQDNKESFNLARKELDKAQNGYRETGEVLRKDNQYEVERAKEDIEEIDRNSEQERLASEKKNQQTKDAREKFMKENTFLQDERISVNSEKTDRRKADQVEHVLYTEQLKSGNEYEVEAAKERVSNLNSSKSEQAKLQRRIDREELFEVERGAEKDFDDYNSIQGTEDLAEGVTERSFEMNQGRKLVIERTVKLGNKIDKYSKVIDKNATYYFKNNRSITKSTWDRETLSLAD